MRAPLPAGHLVCSAAQTCRAPGDNVNTAEAGNGWHFREWAAAIAKSIQQIKEIGDNRMEARLLVASRIGSQASANN